MDNTLTNIKEVCSNLLPLLGLIALIVLIVLVIELIKTVKNANKVLDKTKITVDLVDDSIKKVQAPLDSAVKISHTVDVAHDATIKGIGEAKEFINKNADILKEKINELSKKELESKEKDLKEPNPDDILKGE